MPIYEYQCQSCKHALDALQKMNDEPLKVCPVCGEPELKKLLSAPRFRLKGGGWYETDFKDKNRRNIADGDSSAAPDKSKGDSKDKPKDTTAATKTDTGSSTKTSSEKPLKKTSGD